MGDGICLLVDGLARKKLTREQVREFVHAMPSPAYLDMTIIAGPEVKPVQGGWYGWCIVAESHVILHSNGLEVHADVFSCKAYDPEPVLDYCRERLGLEQVQHQIIQRGWGWDV